MFATILIPILTSCAVSQPFQAKHTFTVDVRDTTPISPYIYGANNVEWDKLPIKVTANRLGGNRITAYNWETNASNAGADWHHQNDGLMGATNEPGWAIRTFLEGTQAHGAATLITIPTAGHVAADKKGDGDVNQTPDYLNVRFNRSVAHKPGGNFVYPPDVTDKVVYEDECVAWIEKIKSKTLPVWYILDNEPDIWSGTHARIVLKPLTYAQIVANNIEYASAIKAVAPNTLVFGWASYGWAGFRTFQGASDANGRDFTEFYLTSMKDAGSKAGKRLLDVLDLHWYPEARGGGVRICEGTDKPGTAEARIQAPRSLWDSSYVEESWIADTLGKKPIMLLPRTLDQIAKCYPGTKLAINEYNYGGGKVISGAIAQADVLGLYGRYGVFVACNWGLSPADTAMIAGYNAFLNFDGNGSKFGDQMLKVSGESPAENSLYAARDTTRSGRITLVAINKTTQADPMKVVIPGLTTGKARAFAVTAQSLSKAMPLDANVGSGGITFVAPALSIVTVEVTR
jgi:hypothetical protein